MSPPEAVPVRAAIADDEPLARRLLRGMLEAREGIEVVGEAEDGEQAVVLVTEQEPDVLFLDVQMPGMDGFQVLEALALGRLPRIVFVTAYDEYALRAFEVHALDYLLKPFDEERLDEALRRVREQLRAWDRARPESADADSGLRALLRDLARWDSYAERLAITRGERTGPTSSGWTG